jgi:CTP-dependent riboflavin kinase
MDDEMVSVIDIANELGKRKQSIFKVLNRLNIERNFEKSEASRGQRIAYINA